MINNRKLAASTSILLLLFAGFFCKSCYGNEEDFVTLTAEKIAEIIENAKSPDEKKGDKLFEEALSAGLSGKSAKALVLYRQALDAYDGIAGTESMQGACHTNIAMALIEQFKNSGLNSSLYDAIEHARVAVDLLGRDGEQADTVEPLMGWAWALIELGKPKQALLRMNRAAEIVENALEAEYVYNEDDLKGKLAKIYKEKGIVFYKVGDNNGIINSMRKALEYFESLLDTTREKEQCYLLLGLGLNNYAVELMASEYYPIALSVLDEAREYFRLVEFAEEYLAINYDNRGNVLTSLHRYEEARTSYERSLGLYKTVPETEQKQVEIQSEITILNTILVP